MNADNRAIGCNAFFEDYPISEFSQLCHICKALGTAHLKGSHPRKMQAAPATDQHLNIPASRSSIVDKHVQPPQPPHPHVPPEVVETVVIPSQRLPIQVKDGDKLSLTEYNIFLPCRMKIDVYHSVFESVDKSPLMILVNNYIDKLSRIRTSNYFASTGKTDESEYIRPLSRQFLSDILTVMEVKGTVDDVSIRKDEQSTAYSVDLRTSDSNVMRINGKTDAAIYYAGVRIATWQDNNFTSGNIDNVLSESQVMVEVEAAARCYRKQLIVQPKEICGILAAGKQFMLFTRVCKAEEAMWIKTVPIDIHDESQKKSLILLILQFVSVLKTLIQQVDSVLTPSASAADDLSVQQRTGRALKSKTRKQAPMTVIETDVDDQSNHASLMSSSSRSFNIPTTSECGDYPMTPKSSLKVKPRQSSGKAAFNTQNIGLLRIDDVEDEYLSDRSLHESDVQSNSRRTVKSKTRKKVPNDAVDTDVDDQSVHASLMSIGNGSVIFPTTSELGDNQMTPKSSRKLESRQSVRKASNSKNITSLHTEIAEDQQSPDNVSTISTGVIFTTTELRDRAKDDMRMSVSTRKGDGGRHSVENEAPVVPASGKIPPGSQQKLLNEQKMRLSDQRVKGTDTTNVPNYVVYTTLKSL